MLTHTHTHRSSGALIVSYFWIHFAVFIVGVQEPAFFVSAGLLRAKSFKDQNRIDLYFELFGVFLFQLCVDEPLLIVWRSQAVCV